MSPLVLLPILHSQRLSENYTKLEQVICTREELTFRCPFHPLSASPHDTTHVDDELSFRGKPSLVPIAELNACASPVLLFLCSIFSTPSEANTYSSSVVVWPRRGRVSKVEQKADGLVPRISRSLYCSHTTRV